MRIVHISIYPEKDKKHPYGSGVSSYTKNLITNIPYQKDDEVFILCNKIDRKYERYTEDNIRVIRCFDKKIKFFLQILKEIKAIKPDIIHIQQELGLFGGILTAYLLQWLLFLLRKCNLIITLHGVVSLKKIEKNFIRENNANLTVWLTKLAFYIIYKPLCIWSKKIIVHEDYFKNILINEYQVNPDKIEVIPHGVENLKPINKRDACNKLNLSEKKNIILFMGYLIGYKGIDLLVEGFAKYSKINPDAYLIIGAGKHPRFSNNKKYLAEYKRLQDKAKELINKNQYKWVGFIDEKNIVNYYNASDILVFPYTVCMSSSGPMNIAIGYEKPFLVSDVFDKIIENKKMVFRRNPEALADKLKGFFEEKFKFEIKKMKEERLWNKVGNKTYKIYEKLFMKNYQNT